MEPAAVDLKKTVHLPKTDFAMKANLPQNEPKLLEKWSAGRLYHRIREARKGAPTYVLHDGPPYANGNIHLGHAFNKILKDFIVKSKTMGGFDSPEGVPRVRAEVRESAVEGFPAAGCAGAVGSAVHDDGGGVRGCDRAGVR